MKVLIVYGTTEGQTRKIAEYVAERVGAGGDMAELHDSARAPRDFDVTEFDAAIVIASIHQQAHQPSVARFVRSHLDPLQAKPTLFLSVSLSAAFEEGRTEAMGYVDQFLTDTGLRPTATHLVAGALRHSEYDYFEREIVEHVVLKDREIAKESDQELTDWDNLSNDVDAFLQSARQQVQSG